MRIIVSSKELSSSLSQIDFKGGEFVKSVKVTREHLIVYTETNVYVIGCEVARLYSQYWTMQGDARWDWLADVVKVIAEQPIVLEITPDKVQLTLTF